MRKNLYNIMHSLGSRIFSGLFGLAVDDKGGNKPYEPARLVDD